MNEQIRGRLVHRTNQEYVGECIQRLATRLGWTGIPTSCEYSKLRYEYSTEQAQTYLNTLAPSGHEYGPGPGGHWGLWPKEGARK
jgi:predicted solute-binding protein